MRRDTISQTSWSAGKICWAHRSLYLKVCALAACLALAVCACIPKEYYAETIITDENEGMDVIIGLNSISATIQQSKPKNQGIENSATYVKLLLSRSFASRIADIEITPYHVSYGEYLQRYRRLPWWEQAGRWIGSILGAGPEDLLAEIQDNMRCRTVSRTGMITIQVKDQDPVVAALLTDSIMRRLQNELLAFRSVKAKKELEVASLNRKKAQKSYMEVQRQYARFIDSHFDIASAEDKAQLAFLEKETDQRQKEYNNANIDFSRAKALVERSVPPFNTLSRPTVPLKPFRPIRTAYILAYVFIGLVFTTWYVLYRQRRKISTPTDYGDLFSPWTVTIGIWAIIMLLFRFGGHLVSPLAENFYVSLGLWVPILCLSALATYLLLPASPDVRKTCGESIETNKFFFNGLFLLIVIFSPLYLYQILKIVSQFDMQNLLYNIRFYNVNGDTSFGIINYAHILSQTALIIAIWHYPKMPLWQLVMVFIANLICFAATMGKATFFIIFVSISFVLYEKGKIKIRTIGLAGIGLVVLFFFFNLAREEQTSLSSAGSETTFMDFFLMYILSPPVAFSTLQDRFAGQFGYSSLSAIYRLINDWTGSQFVVNPGIQEFAWVPIPTNVYTIFQPFYEDFKYHGIAFFALVYGTISGWLYRLSRNGNAIGKCIYTYFLVHLFMQFFMEDILLSFVAFSEFAIITIVCTQSTICLNFAQHAAART